MAESIFERLGGRETFVKVVDHFYELVLADELLKPYFAETEMAEQAKHQVAFMSALAGGPVFAGRSMSDAHAGMKITDEAFGAVAGHLSAALDHFKVPEDDKSAMMTAAAGLQGDIVGK